MIRNVAVLMGGWSAEREVSLVSGAAVAKAKAGRVAELAVQEAVQMHGGVGMTDEFDVGLFVKRVRVLNELLGDTGFHQEAVARSQGF